MSLESSTSMVPKEPVSMKIQKIDVIHRYEFETMVHFYKMPVMFKTVEGSYQNAG